MEKASNDNDNDLVEASGESVMSRSINGQKKYNKNFLKTVYKAKPIFPNLMRQALV